MTSTVGVHRIGNYCHLAASGSVEAATDAISEEWTGSPGKGLVGFGLPPSDRPRLRVAYYAHLLHRAPRKDATTWRSSTSTSRSCSSTGSTSSCACRKRTLSGQPGQLLVISPPGLKSLRRRDRRLAVPAMLASTLPPVATAAPAATGMDPSKPSTSRRDSGPAP